MQIEIWRRGWPTNLPPSPGRSSPSAVNHLLLTLLPLVGLPGLALALWGRQEIKIRAGGVLRGDGGEKDEREKGGSGNLRSYPGGGRNPWKETKSNHSGKCSGPSPIFVRDIVDISFTNSPSKYPAVGVSFTFPFLMSVYILWYFRILGSGMYKHLMRRQLRSRKLVTEQ